MPFRATVILLALQMTTAEKIHHPDPTCDYILIIRNGRKMEIDNPGFPGLYKESMTCRWIINCPVNFLCHLRCRDLVLPQSDECEKDKLLVSTIGSLELNNADAYCGRMVIDTKSINQRITMGIALPHEDCLREFYSDLESKVPLQIIV